MKIKALATLAGALCATALLTSAPAQAQKNSLQVTNNSYWTIDQLYLSSADTDEWGSDQLGDRVIGGGETFTLRSISCGTYDVKLVDEEGDECEIKKVDFCSGKSGWTITSDFLLDCEARTQGK